MYIRAYRLERPRFTEGDMKEHVAREEHEQGIQVHLLEKG